MNKKLTLIIALQTLLIVVLFWVLIFYGKDEYESYQANLNDEIEAPSHVADVAGISVVSISPEIQKNSGISTAKLTSASFNIGQKSVASVIAIDSLIEAKSKYLNLLAETNIARANNAQNLKLHQRLKALNEDDKNVSDRVVQEALAAANAEQAKISAAELQLKNLQITTKLQWGEVLSKLVFSEQLSPHLQALLDRKNVLLLVGFPNGASTPKTINISPLNDETSTTRAVYISPASQTDATSYGKTFYYCAPAESLRIGMRVRVDVSAGAARSGAVIPSKAVVWYAGKPWAYFKQSKEQFVRTPITTDTEVNGGWFNVSPNANAEVVVSGAQLLLSEEFKYQIKNENED